MKPLILAALALPMIGDAPTVTHDDPLGFSQPTVGITIQPGQGDDPSTMKELLNLYGQVTNVSIAYTDETATYLESTKLGISEAIEVPADRVHETVQALAMMHDFALVVQTSEEPLLVEVVSLNTGARSTIRNNAVFVEEEHLDAVAQYPAVMFTTVVTLPHTDVRQLSNSMRTMITDANTQQMLPAGSSNSMVIVGTGRSVVGMVEMLKRIDAASAPK